MPALLRPLAPPSLRERIGGRWAITWWGFIGGSAVIGFNSLLPLLNVRIASGRIAAQPAALLAVVVMWGLWLLLMRSTLLRHRATRPVPIWLVFAISGAPAFPRMGILLAYGSATGVPLPSWTYVVAGTIAAALAGSLVLPTVAYVSATRDWYIRERDRLIDLASREEAARLRAIGALDALRDVTLVALQDDVDGTRSLLDRDDVEPDAVAHALLRTARTGVRPAAHTLIGQSARNLPRVSMRDAIRGEFQRTPLPILPTAILLPALIAPRLVLERGPVTALVMVVLVVSALLILFPVGRRLIRGHPHHAFGLTIAACLAVPLPFLLYLGLRFNLASLPLLVPIVSGILFALVVLAGGRRALETSSEQALEQMLIPVRTAEVERLAAEWAREDLLRELGAHLHGTVQPGLIAASYAIQDAVQREDAAQLDAAIVAARAALDRRITPEPTTADDDLLALLQDDWRGLLDIDWQVDAADLAVVPHAAEVIRECLGNAVVHGRATRVSVMVRRAGAELVVEVADNGSGPGFGPSGLGTVVLDEATEGRWSIDRAPDGGTVVRARIACS